MNIKIILLLIDMDALPVIVIIEQIFSIKQLQIWLL